MENKNNVKRTKLKPNKLEMANLMLPRCSPVSAAPAPVFSSYGYVLKMPLRAMLVCSKRSKQGLGLPGFLVENAQVLFLGNF